MSNQQLSAEPGQLQIGVRQAFDKPVTLIQDNKTPRIFDTASLRTYEYDVTLRVDAVKQDIDAVAESLKQTAQPGKNDVNSLVSLLKMRPAAMPQTVQLSEQDSVVLDELRNISKRLANLEKRGTLSPLLLKGPSQSGSFGFYSSNDTNRNMFFPAGSAIEVFSTPQVGVSPPLVADEASPSVLTTPTKMPPK